MATELEQIRKRIDGRDALNLKDRARQRELLMARKAEGATWDEMQAEAGVSRPTLNFILNGVRPRRGKSATPTTGPKSPIIPRD